MATAEMTEIEPLISVCIANYNGMDVIDDCLRSVLGQEGSLNVEILVHDDSSNDGSVAYIRDRYPQVTLIESTENVGFCIANNRMASEARGAYLLLLNNDATLYSDALQTLLTEVQFSSVPAILSLPQYDAASGVLIDRGCMLDPFFNPVPNLDTKRCDVAMVIGACLWIPKALWKELGGFPEWFGSIAEDMYLCCRARLAGYPVRVGGGSGYRHWQGMSFGGGRVAENRLLTTFRRRALSERNKSYVLAVIYPSPWMYFIFFLHMLFLLLEGGLLTIARIDRRFWLEIYAPCFKSMWQERQRLWLMRRDIQRSRTASTLEIFSVFRLIPYKLFMLIRYGMPHVR